MRRGGGREGGGGEGEGRDGGEGGVYCIIWCFHRDLSWVKIFNVDQRYEANRITGHLQAKLVYYLLNIHTLPRHIYLCRVRAR